MAYKMKGFSGFKAVETEKEVAEAGESYRKKHQQEYRSGTIQADTKANERQIAIDNGYDTYMWDGKHYKV